jgi:hypothetical protein
MTQKEFISILKEEEYSYDVEGDLIVVTGGDKDGYVNLNALTSLPPGVVFKNRGDVELRALTSLPSGVKFENGGDVYLSALTSLPPGVVFKNEGSVKLSALIGGGGWFEDWSGNIEGIGSKRLLNMMIKQGIFKK